MSQKFIYLHNISKIIINNTDHDLYSLRDLYKSIRHDNVNLTLKRLRDIGYQNFRIEKHGLIDETNLELICYQFEQRNFSPNVGAIANQIDEIVRDIRLRKSKIGFNAATLGHPEILHREIKILENLYSDFNAFSRELIHADQIVSYMAR